MRRELYTYVLVPFILLILVMVVSLYANLNDGTAFSNFFSVVSATAAAVFAAVVVAGGVVGLVSFLGVVVAGGVAGLDAPEVNSMVSSASLVTSSFSVFSLNPFFSNLTSY